MIGGAATHGNSGRLIGRSGAGHLRLLELLRLLRFLRLNDVTFACGGKRKLDSSFGRLPPSHLLAALGSSRHTVGAEDTFGF